MDYNDFTPFRNYLNTLVILSEQEWRGILQIFQIKQYKKENNFRQLEKDVLLRLYLAGVFSLCEGHRRGRKNF
jgi:hypothetical protein